MFSHRDIAMSNTPDVLNDCVADIAFGLMIDVARGLSASDRFVRRGEWVRDAFPLQTRVSGKRLGIPGLGRIGTAIARRAAGFDMDVRYHNRHAVPGVPYQYESTLAGLAQWADFVMVASAGGPDTRHLVSAEILVALDNVVILPHVASATHDTRQAMADLTLANLRSYRESGTLLTPIAGCG